MNIHMPNNYNELESFILKWTFISITIGVIGIFVIKVLYLVGDYIDFKLADDLKGLVLGKLKDIFHF
jgi:hypothetical protein